jgi:hypothetical protein
MTPSTKLHRDSSLILALVAALIVASFDRSWLARPVTELIPPGSGIRLDWLSHLKGRLMGPLIAALELALTPGRRAQEPAPQTAIVLDDEMARIKERYEAKLRAEKKARAQEWLVGVYARLERDYCLSVKLFCKTLGIAERTFRSWRTREAAPRSAPPPPVPPPEPRPQAEGRFGLDHTLPGIQQVADTTDWEILGIPLKVMASQDPGARHTDLWSGFRVSVAESGQVIMDLIEEVAEPGTQVITDRGTPYMSQTGSMDEREMEHAPCKEYTPTEKATKERAFLTVKDALAPLVEFFHQLCERIPELRCPDIAVKLATLLLTVFLRVYHLGHRDRRHPLEDHDPDMLRCIADEQREKARSDFVSKLSTLGRIHDQYDMQMPRIRFVRGHRAHALEDIVEAERRMRPAARRGDVKVPHLYFATVLNDVAEHNRPRRCEARGQQKKASLEKQKERRRKAHWEQLDADPVLRLHRGLDLLATQARRGRLLLGGVGPGRGLLVSAIDEMATTDPLGFRDDVRLECRRWMADKRIGRQAWTAIVDLVEERMGKVTTCSTSATGRAILSGKGREV